jgi:hypothetical protein
LFNPIEDLPFAILIERDMLSSASGLVHAGHKGRLDMESWTIECFHQCINGDWDFVARFCDIPHECNLGRQKSRPDCPEILSGVSLSWFYVFMLEGR